MTRFQVQVFFRRANETVTRVRTEFFEACNPFAAFEMAQPAMQRLMAQGAQVTGFLVEPA